MRATRILAALFAASVLAPASAAAICGVPPDAEVVPTLLTRAPRNVRPRVTLPADFQTRALCRQGATPCPAGDLHVELRTAPSRASRGAVVPTHARVSRLGELATVELVPDAELDDGGRYEIAHVDASGRTPSRLLGAFTTDAERDTTPPAFAGLRDATAHPPRQQQRGKVIVLMAECEAPGVELVGPSAATDDATPAELMRYALWYSDDTKAKLDYASPPRAYLAGATDSRTHELHLWWGGFEMRTAYERPAKGVRARRVGVRAVDLAGNMSAASEVVVDYDARP